MSAAPIRVLLADDQDLVRDMLAARLDDEPDLELVAAVHDASAAHDKALRLEPDVVLMDVEMPGTSPFEAARRIHEAQPSTRVLFISGFIHDGYVAQALDACASGYVSKGERPAAVFDAVRKVAAGGVYFSPEIRCRLVLDVNGPRLGGAASTRLHLLTPRELDILTYLARGYAKKKIASLAGISVKTVEQHCSHVMDKLDIHDRVALARFAIREGLIRP
jgi:two-component system response regulator NreC